MKPAPTCGDAALGMEHGTRDLRAPDHEIVRSMTGHCVEAPWSSAAIGCFAAMKSEDLGRCIGLLGIAGLLILIGNVLIQRMTTLDA